MSKKQRKTSRRTLKTISEEDKVWVRDVMLKTPERIEAIEQRVHKLFETEQLDKLLKSNNGEAKVMGQKGRPTYKQKRLNVNEIMEKNQGRRVIPMSDEDDGFSNADYVKLQAGSPEFMLTPLEHRFVIAYCQMGDASAATEAALTPEDKKRPRNLKRLGHDIMRRPHIRKAIGYMQKKLCVAAALDAPEVISSIRQIIALAVTEGKFDAALKGNLMLGEYLGIFNKDKGGRPQNPKEITLIPELFKSGDELGDTRKDIKRVASTLGFDFDNKVIESK